MSELEVWTKVGELDRANLNEGQDALLQLDAIPDKQFRGKIKAMSGTATSDVFSGDPSKKFDVIFSIDMRQLLTGLGMKSADVDRIMATAEANSKKNLVNTASSFFANLQGGVPAGTAGGAPGMQSGAPGSQGAMQGGAECRVALAVCRGCRAATTRTRAAGNGQRGRGGNRGGGRGGGAPAAAKAPAAADGAVRAVAVDSPTCPTSDRQKMRHLRQQLASAKPEDQPKIQQQIQDLMTKAGAGASAGPGGRGGPGGGRQGQGGPGNQAQADTAPGGRGRGMSVANPLDLLRRSNSPFTDEERKNAKLPLPPEQDSQVQALLRPGLLADVEIVVEKIPDALHVPGQAVFDKEREVHRLRAAEERPVRTARSAVDETERIHDGAGFRCRARRSPWRCPIRPRTRTARKARPTRRSPGSRERHELHAGREIT